MSIVKPYTFVANTKARANEVNQDIDILYTQVNTNISAIAQNASDIADLDDDKADVNGSSSQRFAVANPVNNFDAVNKQSLISSIGNSIDLISGLTITKDSNSPTDTIIVDTGSAYDSTKAVCLTLSNSTSKQQSPIGASTTYYVHIIGNATGSSTDILISSSQISPAMPSGYTLYRCIGLFTTNSDSEINAITSYGIIIQQTFPATKAVLIETYTSGTSGYRIWTDGYCEQWGEASTSAGDTRYRNVTYLKTFADNNYNLINDCIRASMTNDGSSWIFSKSATGCTLCGPDGGVNRLWRASGYLASGQY